MRETIYKLNTPVSICLLTDLHEKDFSFLSNVRDQRPDMIAVAGDILHGYTTDENTPLAGRMNPFLSACANIAPTFFSLGNHEWMIHPDDIEAIKMSGVNVLDNNWINWNGLCIGGLTSASVTAYRRFRTGSDLRYPQWNMQRSRIKELIKQSPLDLDWMDEFSSQPGYKILLTHHPEYWPMIKSYDIDLALAGHAHGGQMRIFGQGLFAPGQGLLPKLTSGVHDGRLVISRGLSNTAGIIPRLFNPREIVYVL